MASPSVPDSTALNRWTKSVTRYGVAHLRLRQVAELVNRLHPKRMLDVGCATGFLRELCPGIDYTGCDFTQPEGADFPFYRCDFNAQPLPAELQNFDVIACSGILEYIEDVPGFLKQMHDRLAPGGHLVTTYFNMNHGQRLWTLFLGRTPMIHPDWRGFYAPRTLEAFIRQAGFDLTESYVSTYSLGKPPAVDETVNMPLRLKRAHFFSFWFAHQFLYVARRRD